MRERNISPLTGFDRKGDTHNPCPHGVDGSGLGIKSKKRRVGEALKPPGKGFLIQHRFILGVRRGAVFRRFVEPTQVSKPGLELKLGVELAQRLFIRSADL